MYSFDVGLHIVDVKQDLLFFSAERPSVPCVVILDFSVSAVSQLYCSLLLCFIVKRDETGVAQLEKDFIGDRGKNTNHACEDLKNNLKSANLRFTQIACFL